uniref:CBF domain-containing protein n=1 Tax=Syphacia muris TaxID=451379 RepID=A0A0N5A7P4_9BILA
MKFVFATYFRVLKRMVDTSFLEPVLEGLSQFAHLLNVEYFGDLTIAMESLVEKQSLSILSSVHCINAVFVILSGEGAALNIDPSKFYRLMYGLLCSLPFERSYEKMVKQIDLVIRTLHIMFIVRRKQVPLPRVAAFVKRLVDVAVYLPSTCSIAILALLRQIIMVNLYFI